VGLPDTEDPKEGVPALVKVRETKGEPLPVPPTNDPVPVSV
jgi:hypothetical protein